MFWYFLQPKCYSNRGISIDTTETPPPQRIICPCPLKLTFWHYFGTSKCYRKGSNAKSVGYSIWHGRTQCWGIPRGHTAHRLDGAPKEWQAVLSICWRIWAQPSNAPSVCWTCASSDWLPVNKCIVALVAFVGLIFLASCARDRAYRGSRVTPQVSTLDRPTLTLRPESASVIWTHTTAQTCVTHTCYTLELGVALVRLLIWHPAVTYRPPLSDRQCHP